MTTGAAPLAGVRVVVTRAAHQAAGLAAAFAAAGAQVETLPLLAVVPAADPEPLRRAAADLALFDWLVFTSANAVTAFMPLAAAQWPPRLRVAAVGDATAAALRSHGIEPHWPPAAAAANSAALPPVHAVNPADPAPPAHAAPPADPAHAAHPAPPAHAAFPADPAPLAPPANTDGLLAMFAARLRRGDRVLLPQAADARTLLARGLAAAGAEVEAVVAYDKGFPPAARRRAGELFTAHPLGWVTFTSPRIVRHFTALFAAGWPRRRVELAAASIGTVTSAELRRQGVEPAAEAARPTDAALVDAVIEAVARGVERRP